LEQYHSANTPSSIAAPKMTVPTMVIPEPATPFPMPVTETLAPVYAPTTHPPSVYSPNDSWDSEDITPIAPPQPTLDFQPTPQHSLDTANPFLQPNQNAPIASAPPSNVFPVVDNTMSPSFAQSAIQAPPQPIPQTPPPSMAIQTPAVLIEEVPVHGTAMVARVGTQIILMGDILPKLRRLAQKIVAENLKRMPEEERAKIPPQEIEQGYNSIITELYPQMLQEQIHFNLVYSDYLFQQPKEQRVFFDEKMGEEFDRKEMPEMMKEFNVTNVVDLKRYLEQELGSSLEKEKKLWIQEQIVRQWIMMSIQRGSDPTQDELLDFYESNKTMFTSTPRARWQEMTVLFSRHSTEQEAWSKMRWMGNQAASGTSFEEIAKTHSEGFTAAEGGVWDWTTKGSLTSTELEQAVFSQPEGLLSPAIIKSERGLHIIRVLERQEETVTPFIEAQVAIREKIKNLRTQRQQDEYLADLRRRFPPVIVRDRIDFDLNNIRTASVPYHTNK